MTNQPREEAWGNASPHYRLADAQPPQPRESRCAHHLHTGPGAEGGGGWPMHATAQRWHAEGRPLTTGALRRLRSLATLPAASPMQRN